MTTAAPDTDQSNTDPSNTDPSNTDQSKTEGPVGARGLTAFVVAVMLALPIVVFFAPTLAAGNSPGGFDLSYQSSPWRDEVRRPLDAQSPAQVDQAEQLPWVDGMWDSLRAGRIPMWTPAVGGGTSLGTNPVFATYSLFTIVGELAAGPFGGAIGLAVRVMLAVAVGEFFTYLFLRRLHASQGASIVGTVAYVFSGSVLVFETRNAIPLLLPVAMWATDRLVERVSPRRVAALSVAVLAMWLEGFPALLVHVLAIAGAWWFVRTVRDRGVDLRRRETRQGWIRAVTGFAGSIVLGVALSAFSAIPFWLQLGYNDVFAARASEASTLPSVAAWWLLDEGGLGKADRGPWFMALNPFEGLAAVGTLVALLVMAAMVVGGIRAGSGRSVRPGPDLVRNFWAIVVVILMSSVYLGGPLLKLLYALPGFGGNPFWRIRFVLAFGLSVLATVGVGEIERLWSVRSSAAARSWGVRDVIGLRWPHLLVSVATIGAIAAPFVTSFDTYLEITRPFSDRATSAWSSELLALGIGVFVGALLLWLGRRVPPRFQPFRTVVFGAFLAGVVFVQVGLQLTRFTPQADRAFYFPTTAGYDALRDATGGGYRFIGSGMGTFAPNSAMTNDVVDARSHSFRDPQWKALILSVFPDATKLDPLKINVDFRGNVLWNAPAFDDLSLGVLAMSSSEVPLGDRSGAPPAVRWQAVTVDRDLDGIGLVGPYVGVDLQLRTSGDCGQGVVVVAATAGASNASARRPLSDATAAGAAGASLPFALAMDDAGKGDVSRMRVVLEGAPADCRVDVGFAELDEGSAQLAIGPILRPSDAPWQLVSSIGGWLYSRPSAAPLVRTISSWTAFDRRSDALAAAVAPDRKATDPMPVAFAGQPRAVVGNANARVTSWSTDDSGLSAAVSADSDTLLVTSFNSAPGWTVAVDGEPRTLVEPDGAFLGVAVGPGTHDVRFDYRPPGLKAGSLVTLFAGLVLVALVGWPRLERRFRSRSTREQSASGVESPETPTDVAHG